MTQQPKQEHQRYHVTFEGKRTTISLDIDLAGLLAVRLGEDNDWKKANNTVGKWLQERTKEDGGGHGLNRRLIRQAQLTIADNKVFSRWAETLGKNTPAGNKNKGLENNRLVLYLSDGKGTPDILSLGNTAKEVKTIAIKNETGGTAEDIAAKRIAAIEKATMATKELEKFGCAYIRKCTEECWNRIKSDKGLTKFKPVVSDDGATWMTYKERAEWRKTHLWDYVLKPELERTKQKTPTIKPVNNEMKTSAN
jgi:hypothetical protein